MRIKAIQHWLIRLNDANDNCLFCWLASGAVSLIIGLFSNLIIDISLSTAGLFCSNGVNLFSRHGFDSWSAQGAVLWAQFTDRDADGR